MREEGTEGGSRVWGSRNQSRKLFQQNPVPPDWLGCRAQANQELAARNEHEQTHEIGSHLDPGGESAFVLSSFLFLLFYFSLFTFYIFAFCLVYR